ncbi:hypothetical protein [Pseudoalteromonas rubra]|uniref:hypothetical protein n=1 Tax=Pseudoalteromonas rubra TaxID=43658 RepID=UPI0012E0BAC4|nr:hypothetical protein [Pseudoalteromonas rubra]
MRTQARVTNSFELLKQDKSSKKEALGIINGIFYFLVNPFLWWFLWRACKAML